jgi:AcrR family transcriptional regulator
MTTAVEAGRGGRLPRVARRRQLLAAAQEVFVAQGYHGAAMDDIAERAGVSKPVLYQHFPGKLELYLALIDAHTDALVATIRDALAATDDNQERVHAVLAAYFDFIDGATGSGPGAFRLIFETDLGNEPAVRERVERADRAIMRAVSDTVSADTGLSRPQAELLAIALTGAAQVAARWWLDNDRPVPRDVAVRLIASLQWRGISNFPLHGGADGG